MKQKLLFPLFGLFLLAALALLNSCANVIPPAGGEKDTTPPAVVKELSTPNFQTQFKRQRISLTFDEWVELVDVAKSVVVSPPLEHPFELSLKGKTIRFDFDEREVLRDSATYTINFGDAVKDLTEKNPAKDLRFVFATGDQLDSLRISGSIVDALDGKPIEGALFMLYDNLADSVVRTQKPFYFGRTNKEGMFQIENIKAGQFKGFALVDSDFNYLFNFKTERIGFTDGLITIPADSAAVLKIKLFSEEIPLAVSESNLKGYGAVKIVFNRTPNGVTTIYDPPGSTVFEAYDRDTLRIWYQPNEAAPLRNFYLQADSVFQDTLTLNPISKEEFLATAKLRDADVRPATAVLRANPGKDFRIQLNHPLSTVDTSRIFLYEDTTRLRVQPAVSINEKAPQELLFKFPWKENKRYDLEIMPGALSDWYGLSNDTIFKKWTVEPVKSFGNINLTISGLDASLKYVAQLFFQDNNLVETMLISGQESYNQRFSLMAAGNYSVRIVTDLNGNGRWDTGLYDAKRQPEPIFTTKLEPLRANWDLETQVVLKNE